MLTDILLDLFAWTLITVGVAGFILVCWEAWRTERQHRQRREWQRMPETQVRPNLRKVL